MHIEKAKTQDLIPYVNNAKVHSEKQVDMIAASIKEFGFNNPILVDGGNGVIAGHGRLMAAKKLGLTEVPVIELAHLTEAQRKAYILADNRLGEVHTEWDMELVNNELDFLQEMDFDIDLTGFESPEVIGEGLADEDAVPELPDEPVTKLGDVWILGKHRLKCGDSTSIDDMDSLVNGARIDLLLTDPPYNVAYEGKTADSLTIQNDAMSDEDFRQFLADAFIAADSVMKPGAVFYIWHADVEGFNFLGACKDASWQVRQCLIWQKQTLVMGRKDYHCKHEPCLYGWKDGAGHLWASDRKQTTILEFDRPQRNAEHPTMKPVELFEYQLLNNTKGEDNVLDSFGGSGTAIIACEKNGRTGFSMELDERYCDVIVKRWQDYTGKDAVLESSGETFNSLNG